MEHANAKELSASELKALGVIVDKPRFPKYALPSERRDSFQSCPESHPMDKEDMIEAGLFYTGEGDVVGCYFCGGSLRQWEFNDIPMVEHARWYPKCPHVRLARGDNYADLIIRNKDSDEEVTLTDVTTTKKFMAMGYSKNMVSEAIMLFRGKYGNSNYSRADLQDILFEIGGDGTAFEQTGIDSCNERTDSDSLSSLDILREENHRLRERQSCKICMDRNADVVFHPCGHMSTCPQCTLAFNTCPVCRQIITGRIKGSLACFRDIRF